MIIFGTRGITYSKDRGTFFCPDCSEQRQYEWKKVRRFFTLYFIPVFPLDVVGEYIECPQCGGTYREEVLSHDHEAASKQVQAEFHQAIQRIMVHMMLADGQIEDSEVETIGKIYHQLSGHELPRSQIQEQIEQIESSGADVFEDLQQVAAYLNDRGKEMVVRAAVMVAGADGTFQQEELGLLSEIAKAIEMSSAHFKGIFSEVTENQLTG